MSWVLGVLSLAWLKGQVERELEVSLAGRGGAAQAKQGLDSSSTDDGRVGPPPPIDLRPVWRMCVHLCVAWMCE